MVELFGVEFWEKYFKSLIDTGDVGRVYRENIGNIFKEYSKKKVKITKETLKVIVHVLDEIMMHVCVRGLELLIWGTIATQINKEIIERRTGYIS